jgi:hypothetical protein
MLSMQCIGEHGMIMRLFLFVGAFFVSLPSMVVAGTPHDVAAYTDRREGCNHWAGEEGYDAARRAEINKAIADLKCTALGRDEKILRHRYRHNPAVLGQIKKARDAYPD